MVGIGGTNVLLFADLQKIRRLEASRGEGGLRRLIVRVKECKIRPVRFEGSSRFASATRNQRNSWLPSMNEDEGAMTYFVGVNEKRSHNASFVVGTVFIH